MQKIAPQRKPQGGNWNPGAAPSQALQWAVEALAKAGAIVQNAPAWQSHVIEDRELVTGQQPFSDHAFGDALVLQSRSVRSALDGIDTSGILASL